MWHALATNDFSSSLKIFAAPARGFSCWKNIATPCNSRRELALAPPSTRHAKTRPEAGLRLRVAGAGIAPAPGGSFTPIVSDGNGLSHDPVKDPPIIVSEPFQSQKETRLGC